MRISVPILLLLAACAADHHDASPVVPSAPPSRPSASPLPAQPSDAGVSRVPSAAPRASDEECGACGGKLTEDLQAELTRRAGATKRCYDELLGRDASARGRVVVRVRVGASGTVCSDTIARDTVGNEEFASCVRAAFEGDRFPPPVGACVDVNIPLQFIPGDAGASHPNR